MKAVRVGIIGGGWPGTTHAQAVEKTGGMQVTAVCDLIPARQATLQKLCPAAKLQPDAAALVGDPAVDVVVICTPTHTHVDLACLALKKGKTIVIEPPAAASSSEARKIARQSEKYGKPAFVSLQRRFGGVELAAKLAIEKGLIGEPYAVRASWTRSRAIPLGTGWYGRRDHSGGGALMDLGLPLLDLAGWYLGSLEIENCTTVLQRRFSRLVPPNLGYDTEDAATCLLNVSGGKSIELSVAWAINQPPGANMTSLRVHGTEGCMDVYTSEGAVVYRNFNERGDAQRSLLKPPNVAGYDRLWRHVKDVLAGKEGPACTAAASVELIKTVERLYRSAPTISPYPPADAALQSPSK